MAEKAEKMLPLKEAERSLQDKSRLQKLLQAAVSKAQKNKEKLNEIYTDLQTLLRMLKAYIRGQYTVIPWKTLLKTVAAIIYFVNPFDLIPDFLPALGFLDDISVVGFVIASLKDDIDAFSEFEETGQVPVNLEEVQHVE